MAPSALDATSTSNPSIRKPMAVTRAWLASPSTISKRGKVDPAFVVRAEGTEPDPGMWRPLRACRCVSNQCAACALTNSSVDSAYIVPGRNRRVSHLHPSAFHRCTKCGSRSPKRDAEASHFAPERRRRDIEDLCCLLAAALAFAQGAFDRGSFGRIDDVCKSPAPHSSR